MKFFNKINTNKGNMKLIDILKEIMIERNLNQTTFAKLIGVKQKLS